MITRTGKIARLPKKIREQLNRRLENGETARTILPWLNALPGTKRILTEQFESKPIRAQNLSEWKKGGYMDWLQQQQRLEWFDHFCENETELARHDQCNDTFEAMSRIFIVEIGQSIAALRTIKNSQERSLSLQNLVREFSRLQNAFNFSRKTQLDFDKHNGIRAAEPEPEIEDDDDDETFEEPADEEIENEEALANDDELAPLGAPASRRHVSANSPEPHTEPETSSPSPPQKGGEGWGEEALRAQGDHQVCSPTEDCGLRTVDSLPPEKSDQIPPTPPPPPIIPPRELQHHYQPAPPKPPVQKYSVHSMPTRRHRLRYIEG